MSGKMMSPRALLLVSLALVACFSPLVSGLIGHCSTNTYDSNTTWLQFTKEVSTTEYVVNSKFKSLHCCAKGYRSIEWYKDSRVYPWPAGVSTFILYPEAANQTVYTQQALESDAGNYTCVLRNDTHILVHTTILTSVEKPPLTPRATFTPSDKWVDLGESVRMYCEAFVGKTNLPDAKNDISWKRVFPEGSKRQSQMLPQHLIKRENRDDGQIIGALFNIDEVRSNDYGQYICSIANSESTIEIPVWLHQEQKMIIPDNAVPWRDFIFIVVFFVLFVLTIGALYIRFGTTAINTCKNIGVIGAKNVSKDYDILALCTDAESPTMEVMTTVLSNHHGYKSASCHIVKDSNEWFDEASKLATASNSILMMVSQESFSSPTFKDTLMKVHSLNPETKPIIVFMQHMPKFQNEPKDSNGINVEILLKKSKTVLWQTLRDESFWLKLLRILPLPCQRSCQSESPDRDPKSPNLVAEVDDDAGDLNKITVCNSPRDSVTTKRSSSGVMV